MPLRLSPDLPRAPRRSPPARSRACGCAPASPLVAEICAGAGLDWLLIDTEHSPNGLESTLAQLQAVAAYPVTPLVRAPIGDVVMIKQLLDLGAQNLLVPMVSSAEQAREMVAAVRYPPRGVRGVGSALARAGALEPRRRLPRRRPTRTCRCSCRSRRPRASRRPARSPPSTASTGSSSDRPTSRHPWVCSVSRRIRMSRPPCCAPSTRCARAGTPVGVNAFDPELADRYLGAGASFVLVGADVVAPRPRLRGPRGPFRPGRARRARELLTEAPAGAWHAGMHGIQRAPPAQRRQHHHPHRHRTRRAGLLGRGRRDLQPVRRSGSTPASTAGRSTRSSSSTRTARACTACRRRSASCAFDYSATIPGGRGLEEQDPTDLVRYLRPEPLRRVRLARPHRRRRVRRHHGRRRAARTRSRRGSARAWPT